LAIYVIITPSLRLEVGERMSPATPNKPGLPEGPIEPFDLAFACYLYESMTPYKGGLDRFRATTGAAPDLKREDHRLALLKFLNDWGCRNLAKEWHGLASEELDRWYSGAEDLLRLPDGSRADRDMTRLGDLTTVFDSLSTCIAARKVRYGKEMLVSFGPTATSKTLFALRPDMLPAWDGPMRTAFGHHGGGESYAEFVEDIHRKIVETELYCQSRGFSLEDLPAKLERPASTSVVQLVIEYYWITITRGASPPSKSTVREWLAWCDQG
jgi:hypothetical protein